MATTAQTLANQANAQLSTGPRTPEGKARSAANSRSHGYTASTLSIPDADREEFERFRHALQRDTRPEGPVEEEFFGRLLLYAWNLRRVRAAESRLLNETKPFDDDSALLRLERLARYRRDLERSHDRALKELRNLQTQRAILLQQDDSVIGAFYRFTPLADLARLTTHRDPFIAETRTPLDPVRPLAQFAFNRAAAARRGFSSGPGEDALPDPAPRNEAIPPSASPLPFMPPAGSQWHTSGNAETLGI